MYGNDRCDTIFNQLLSPLQLAVEYESNVMIVKVDTDDEYEFAQDMQVLFNIIYIFFSFFYIRKKPVTLCCMHIF